VVNASTAAADAQWIKAHLSANTVFRDLSSVTAKLDIQGPRAREAMEFSLGVKMPDLEYYHFCPIELDGVSCVLSRTGYTGEFGYELYLPAGAVQGFWKKLLAPGQILPAGLGARDTLRVEMGFPLYGHELSEKFAKTTLNQSRYRNIIRIIKHLSNKTKSFRKFHKKRYKKYFSTH